jgi:Delta7-sterol 5-desaturase
MRLSVGETLVVVFLFQSARYLAVAGTAFLVSQRLGHSWVARRRIAALPASPVQARRELGMSLLSIAIFSLIALFVFSENPLRQHSLEAAAALPTWWMVASVPLMLLLHDTYFYWMHRALHQRSLFKWIHKTHHLSHNPSPLAAYAFHPVEALCEAAFLVPLLTLLPIARSSLLAFQVVAFTFNVYGHLGLELLPASFVKTWWFRLFNTTTHHHMHHQLTKANYGLYLNLWDRWLGTNHRDYQKTFVRNATGRSVHLAEAFASRKESVDSVLRSQPHDVIDRA